MSSRSRSSSATTQVTEDSRVAGDNGAVGISADGDVTLHMVPDEAFEMGLEALREMRDLASDSMSSSTTALSVVSDTLSGALAATQEAARAEDTQLSSQIIRIGIPAAALAYVASQLWGNK